MELLHSIANTKNGLLLSNEYKSAGAKLIWKCSQNHVFYMRWKSVQSGHWCSACAKNKKLTIEYCKTAAILHGGECLSEEYKNANSLYWWRCSCGHHWKSTYANVAHHNKWCKKCKYKIVDLIHWKNQEIVSCLGSYEVKVVKFFNKYKIDYLWQPRTFTMPNGKTYRPDLYLPVENKWIEIKGYFYDDAFDKWTWFHKEYPNSELWNTQKLKEMKIL